MMPTKTIEYPERNRERILKNFWAKVAKRDPDQCWIWTGTRDRKGYGAFTIRAGGGYKQTFKATRFMFTLFSGEITPGVLICHRCDNPACVNPFHLFAGSAKDNRQDALQKNRVQPTLARGEGHGMSRFTAADVSLMRQRAERGEKHSVIARDFGVKQSTVSSIIDRRTWAHI